MRTSSVILLVFLLFSLVIGNSGLDETIARQESLMNLMGVAFIVLMLFSLGALGFFAYLEVKLEDLGISINEKLVNDVIETCSTIFALSLVGIALFVLYYLSSSLLFIAPLASAFVSDLVAVTLMIVWFHCVVSLLNKARKGSSGGSINEQKKERY